MRTKSARRAPPVKGTTQERRKSLRLRWLIDEFQALLKENRRDLDLQFTRLAQIQVEVDVLKQVNTTLARQAAPPTPRRR